MRDRTGDLQIFSLTLSQLSYSGWIGILIRYAKFQKNIIPLLHTGIEPVSAGWEPTMAEPTRLMHNVGIEPTTLGLWDLRAANCANRALKHVHYQWDIRIKCSLRRNRTRAHRWQRRWQILTTELIALLYIYIKFYILNELPRIELGTSCVWSRRHNQLDQARI